MMTALKKNLSKNDEIKTRNSYNFAIKFIVSLIKRSNINLFLAYFEDRKDKFYE